jgi:hypothetical protein
MCVSARPPTQRSTLSTELERTEENVAYSIHKGIFNMVHTGLPTRYTSMIYFLQKPNPYSPKGLEHKFFLNFDLVEILFIS